METYVGVVTHYYSHLGVAVVALVGPLQAHTTVHIQGFTTDFCQEIHSLEVNHQQIEAGQPGQVIALKVIDTVRKGDRIFLAPEGVPSQPLELMAQKIDPWER
jgi:hypothetical protein